MYLQHRPCFLLGWILALAGLFIAGSGCSSPKGPIFRDGNRRALPIQRSQVEIDTNLGSFVVELYHNEAPKTVENFRTYVKEGFYEDTLFHRVVEDFVVQGGGYVRGDTGLVKKPTRDPIESEAYNGLRNDRGRLAMARANDKDSATAQFYINVADNEELNHGVNGYGYTVFGEVIQGMDVVDRISGVETIETRRHGSLPAEDIVILNARALKTSEFVEPEPIDPDEQPPDTDDPEKKKKRFIFF